MVVSVLFSSVCILKKMEHSHADLSCLCDTQLLPVIRSVMPSGYSMNSTDRKGLLVCFLNMVESI